ncbi:MAG: hydantoinase/oxoprolinase family protein [Candidatus Tectomicrobia bacterium]|uniref:Hydantoinase/oxoprolinase family protein n=1 Tax=Tectimicrobiota bacterium TaxID=2528274 RepID=A0A932GR95_UNCTE|nr:hydantoinase/oxoprolinase family protein [Candidatus Tectomicrobia bacterium]
MERLLAGIDTGGTFTDFVFLAPDGSVRIHKVPSTPSAPEEAIGQGIRKCVGELPWSGVHGSTVATNAVLEGKGARTALITTAGFEDVLEIGRQIRREIYNFSVERRPVLVPASRRFGVRERVSARGEILSPLDPREVQNLVEELRRQGVESVAICLLFSFLRPEHENRVAVLLRGAGFPCSPSSEVVPEYREYERCSTTVMNAYVMPVMARYLDRLEDGIAPGRLRVMQSNGGSMSLAAAQRAPVHTLLSGPAGGVVGALAVARRAGFDRIISFDMGGTSTDVSLCPGKAPFTSEAEIAGYPVRMPMLAIHSVGAGGGSIARVDRAGGLAVGPESAGADPGPVCYGRGCRLTVTDAHLLLGRLFRHSLLGGQFPLYPARLEAPFEELAQALHMTPLQAAEGVLAVANATMERAIRVGSVEKGHDPKEFTLVSFGGAGGLHACELARFLAIPRVLIPKYPGVLSALGMLMADVVRDTSLSVLRPLSEGDLEEIGGLFSPLLEKGDRELAEEEIPFENRLLECFVDLRYAGQSYELMLPFGPTVLADFHQAHRQAYGHSDPRRPVEVVNLRVRASGTVPRPVWPKGERCETDSSSALACSQDLVYGGERFMAAVFDRDKLRWGHEISGPALVVEFSATTFLPPGFSACVDEYGNLVVSL